MVLLFTPFTVTFANPFKIRFANGICSHLNHFLTDFAVNAKSCVNSNSQPFFVKILEGLWLTVPCISHKIRRKHVNVEEVKNEEFINEEI